MRIVEMITKDESLDVKTSSPNYYSMKRREISEENLNNDAGA